MSNRTAIITLLTVLLLSVATPSHAEEKANAKSKTLLLIGQGPDGHKPGTHEFMAGVRIIKKLLAPYRLVNARIVRADEPWTRGPKKLAEADGVVLFLTQGARWMQNDPRRYQALTKLAQRGGGIVALHWAVGAKDAKYINGQLKLLGGTRGGPNRKYTTLTADLRVVDKEHPVMYGVRDFRVRDELYYRLDLVKTKPAIQPLLSAKIDGGDETVAWAWERADGGRSFGFVGLHFHHNWRRAEYRRMVTQAILWSLRHPVPKIGVKVDLAETDLKLPKK